MHVQLPSRLDCPALALTLAAASLFLLGLFAIHSPARCRASFFSAFPFIQLACTVTARVRRLCSVFTSVRKLF